MTEKKLLDNFDSFMKKMTTLRDALYYTHEKSGASIEEGRGIVVGIVSCLMAQEKTFKYALEIVRCSLPFDYRKECIPESWRKEFV